MTLRDGEFNLQTTVNVRAWPKTISVFLLSVAEAYGNRAVAVILSGMDGDGSAALHAIKAAGGVTFAQSNPAVSSMPLEAVQTGFVDFILPAADIPKALMALADDDTPTMI